MIIVATIGIMNSDADLDGLTALGTGVMLWGKYPDHACLRVHRDAGIPLLHPTTQGRGIQVPQGP